jgi:hypothetical protein
VFTFQNALIELDIILYSIKSKLEEIHSDVDKNYLQKTKLYRSRYFKRLPFPSNAENNVAASSNIRGTRRAQVKTEKQSVNSIPEERISSPPSTDEKKRSIMIPTIVGKSVKGSAQQALLHSRQRARVNPKIVSNAKFNSQKGRDHSATKSATKSSTNSQQEKFVRPAEIRNYLPAQLHKDVLSLLALTVSNSLRGSQTTGLYQSIFGNWFLSLNGKEMSFLAMESILRNATAIKTITFPLVSSAIERPIPFILYFARNMFPETITIISRNFVIDDANREVINPSIFIMHRVMKGGHFQTNAIHEIGIKAVQGFGNLGIVRSWLISTATDIRRKLRDVGLDDSDAIFRRKNTIQNREAESSGLCKISHVALLCLQPQLMMFMFSVNFLRQAVKGNINQSISTVNILHDIVTVFPSNIQRKKKIGVWYRLLHRTLRCKDALDMCENVENTLSFIASKAQVYGVVDCSKEQICITGPVVTYRKRSISSSVESRIYKDLTPQSKSYLPPSVDFFVHIGTDCAEDKLLLEIFALCYTKGITLERYIFEDGSPFAKTMSDYILDLTEATVCDLFQRASADMKRISLWNKYAVAHQAKEKKGCSSICLHQELQDLISLSFSRELSELDSRLMEIVSLTEVGLAVRDLIHAIIEDETVHHYYVFENRKDDNVAYLLYIRKVNIFIVFYINEQTTLSTCTVIGKNCTNNIDTIESDEDFKFAVDLIGTLTFRWIWNNT